MILLSNDTIKNSSLSLIDQAIRSISSFYISVIAARSLDPDDFGLYALIIGILLFIISSQEAFISIPYIVNSQKLKGSELAKYSGDTLIFQIVYSIIVLLLLIWCEVATVNLSLNINLNKIFSILKITLFPIIFYEYARRILFSRFKLYFVLFFDATALIVQVIALTFLFFLNKLTIDLLFIVIMTSTVISLLFWFFWAKNSFQLSFSKLGSSFLPHFHFAKWMLLGSVSMSFHSKIFPWILGYLFGAKEVGIFAACLGIGSIMNFFIIGISNYFHPKAALAYAKFGASNLKVLVEKFTSIIFILSAIFTIILFFTGEALVASVYGGQYRNTGYISSFIGLSVVALAFGLAYDCGLIVIGKTKTNFLINLFILFLDFAIGFFFVCNWAATGAALALILTNTLGSFLRYFKLNSILRGSNRRQFIEFDHKSL